MLVKSKQNGLHPEFPMKGNTFISAWFLAGCVFLVPGLVHAQETTGSAPPQPDAPPPPQAVAPPPPPQPDGAPPPQPEAAPGWAESRVGPELTLFGPNSLIGGGVAYQPIRWVECILWAGYNHATASSSTSSARAEASISVVTGLARARIWLLGRHSVVVDTGLGVTHYSMAAAGHGQGLGSSADTLDYRRAGTPVVGNLGVDYGFRSDSVFRVTVILGALIHASQMPGGTVTSTGAFTEADRTDLRVRLDDAINPLTDPRAYLDASVGFLF